MKARLTAAWAQPISRALRPLAVMAATVALATRLGTDSLLALVVVIAASVIVTRTVMSARSVLRPLLTADVMILTVVTGIVGTYVLGAPVLAAIERRGGPEWAAVGVVTAAALVARWFLRAASALTAGATRTRRASAPSSALLQCHGLDFGYGKVQVLHGVDFEVDEGEMVALLGVNGAGKSTLLRAISGLGLPTAGSIRFGGHDITYLDAESRVGSGINQVPGGRAVFGPLSVVDNLRAYAYGIDRREAPAAIDRALALFPRLDERRNQAASTLSGGEQQMLALAKAVMLRPRLLLIDELSLGLAPVVVGPLLDLVREINAEGTAVVLVEQSVNIALNLARHAYFMERGEVRFDGPSHELLERGDLLRAVFLDGAGDRP